MEGGATPEKEVGNPQSQTGIIVIVIIIQTKQVELRILYLLGLRRRKLTNRSKATDEGGNEFVM